MTVGWKLYFEQEYFNFSLISLPTENYSNLIADQLSCNHCLWQHLTNLLQKYGDF